MILTTETDCQLVYFILLDSFTLCADFKIINILYFIIYLGLSKLGKLFQIETFLIWQTLAFITDRTLLFGFFISNILIVFLYFFTCNLNCTFVFKKICFIWPVNIGRYFRVIRLSPKEFNSFLFLKIFDRQFWDIYRLFWNVWVYICMIIVKISAVELFFLLFKVHYNLLTVIVHF